MKIQLKTKYINEPVMLAFGRYQNNNSIAIQAISEIGEPVATLTTCIDESPDDGCIFVKDWSENEGIIDSLLANGIIEMTGKEIPVNFVKVKEAKLLCDIE